MENKKIISPFDTSNNSSKQSLWELFILYKENKIKKFNVNYHDDLKNYIHTINSISPLLDKPNNILLYGMIQSGKTDFLIGLISNYFSKNESAIALSINQNNKNLLQQTINRTNQIIKNNVFVTSDLKNKKSEIINKIKNKENIIIFSLKEKNNLSSVESLIDEIGNIDYKLIVLDDEGDSASFNNCKKDDYTTIYRLITNIKRKTNAPYISITATPFANVMVSKQDWLKPDYAFFLKPSTGYVGIDYFVNDHNSSLHPSFIEIEEINKDDIDELSINGDFAKAIKFFIVQCFYWKSILKKDEKPRMLINIKKERPSHIEIKKKIEELFDRIRKNVNYLIPIENIFEDLSIDYKYINDFYNELNNIMDNIQINILHGKNAIDTNLDDHEYKHARIIIGHTKIDRGLTIIDLINMFFSSRSLVHPNADLILQQARFLGYREEYKSDMRIFLTKKLISDYEEINNSSQYFMSILNSNSDFKKVENFVPLSNDNNLYPTRASISDFEYVDGSSKYDIIGNKYYDYPNRLDEYNELFYQKFTSIKECEYDSLGNPYLKFNKWSNFAKTFAIKPTNDELKKYLFNLVNTGDIKDEFYINDLISNNCNIYIRLIKENNRKIHKNDNSNYFNIGKGNYCSNEYEFQLKENSISIDIIPLNIYNDEKTISKKIFRTRIFLPESNIIRKGYIS